MNRTNEDQLALQDRLRRSLKARGVRIGLSVVFPTGDAYLSHESQTYQIPVSLLEDILEKTTDAASFFQSISSVWRLRPAE